MDKGYRLDQSELRLIFLIVAPLVVQILRWQPASLFAATAVVYVVIGGTGFLENQHVVSSQQSNVSALSDTYYVVAPAVYYIGLGVVMGCFAALTWLQTRWGAMVYPRATVALFWLLHLAMIAANSIAVLFSFVAPLPRRYTEYSEYFALVNRISAWSALMTSVAVLLLIALMIWSVYRRWRNI